MLLIAPNLWVKKYPLNFLGGHQGRVVTVMRLASGDLIIHSTAPFAAADVAEMRALGNPRWLVEAMLQHDTFAKAGAAALPGITYLAPEGFGEATGVACGPLLPTPVEWGDEVEVLPIEGMPMAKEHVFLHRASRTLIVADLVFNFPEASGWTRFMREALMGVKRHPDSARVYPLLVRDRAAYEASIRRLEAWDFDRIIVGHHEMIERGGRELLRQALARKKMLPS